MKKQFILTLLSVTFLITSSAQELRKNAISLGLGGNNPILGINYAHKFKINETQTRFWEFGVGSEVLLPLAAALTGDLNRDGSMIPFFWMPHHLTYNLGKNGNFLELGYGGSYVPQSNVLLGPRLGYRREKKRTLIKLYTNPLSIGDGRFWPTSLLGFEIGRGF